MYLTRHLTPAGFRWAVDGVYLPPEVNLSVVLSLRSHLLTSTLQGWSTHATAEGSLQAPIEADQEVWGSGVTYLRSREAREAESKAADVYQRVYEAERPELFFKASGWRVRGDKQPVRLRQDAQWNVPEPELTLVINAYGEIVGYTIGNDLSARDIEGENPLYLPQAKIYTGGCAIGPGIRFISPATLTHLEIHLQVYREGRCIVDASTSTGQIKRGLDDLAAFLFRELDFPKGVFLMTGTGIVPSDDFSLIPGDRIRIQIGDLVLENPIAE